MPRTARSTPASRSFDLSGALRSRWSICKPASRLPIGTATATTISLHYASGHTKLTADPDSIGWPVIVATFIALIVLNDVWFYFWHRLMHYPRLFRYVHAVHHTSVDVNPFSLYSVHWVEGVILGGWALPVVLVVPIQRLITDNGPAFHSAAFSEACLKLGIAQKFTRAYRPQTNGKAERFIQSALREGAYGRAYQHSDERLGVTQERLDSSHLVRVQHHMRAMEQYQDSSGVRMQVPMAWQTFQPVQHAAPQRLGLWSEVAHVADRSEAGGDRIDVQ